MVLNLNCFVITKLCKLQANATNVAAVAIVVQFQSPPKLQYFRRNCGCTPQFKTLIMLEIYATEKLYRKQKHLLYSATSHSKISLLHSSKKVRWRKYLSCSVLRARVILQTIFRVDIGKWQHCRMQLRLFYQLFNCEIRYCSFALSVYGLDYRYKHILSYF